MHVAPHHNIHRKSSSQHLVRGKLNQSQKMHERSVRHGRSSLSERYVRPTRVTPPAVFGANPPHATPQLRLQHLVAPIPSFNGDPIIGKMMQVSTMVSFPQQLWMAANPQMFRLSTTGRASHFSVNHHQKSTTSGAFFIKNQDMADIAADVAATHAMKDDNRVARGAVSMSQEMSWYEDDEASIPVAASLPLGMEEHDVNDGHQGYASKYVPTTSVVSNATSARAQLETPGSHTGHPQKDQFTNRSGRGFSSHAGTPFSHLDAVMMALPTRKFHTTSQMMSPAATTPPKKSADNRKVSVSETLVEEPVKRSSFQRQSDPKEAYHVIEYSAVTSVCKHDNMCDPQLTHHLQSHNEQEDELLEQTTTIERLAPEDQLSGQYGIHRSTTVADKQSPKVGAPRVKHSLQTDDDEPRSMNQNIQHQKNVPTNLNNRRHNSRSYHHGILEVLVQPPVHSPISWNSPFTLVSSQVQNNISKLQNHVNETMGEIHPRNRIGSMTIQDKLAAKQQYNAVYAATKQMNQSRTKAPHVAPSIRRFITYASPEHETEAHGERSTGPRPEVKQTTVPQKTIVGNYTGPDYGRSSASDYPQDITSDVPNDKVTKDKPKPIDNRVVRM